jgi:hypothetical protein
LGQNKKNARKTGGGSSEEIPISSIENDVLDIIKKVSVDGHNNAESIVEFEGNIGLEEESVSLSPVAVETSVVETLEEGNKNSKKPKLDLIQERHKKTRKVSYLSNSADASLEYKNYLKIKLESKEKYYETKLELLRRSVEAKERQTTALERISNSLEHVVDQRLLL